MLSVGTKQVSIESIITPRLGKEEPMTSTEQAKTFKEARRRHGLSPGQLLEFLNSMGFWSPDISQMQEGCAPLILLEMVPNRYKDYDELCEAVKSATTHRCLCIL